MVKLSGGDPVYGYFMPAETKSKDGAPGDIEDVLQAELNQWREAYGKPIYITSGFRSRAHNRNVGGASNSLHLVGLAADIHLPHKPVRS